VRVIAFADQVQVEAETLDVRLLRPGERQAAVGLMRRIVDIERVAAAVAGDDALDLERQDIGDRGRALEPLDVNSIGLNSTPRKSPTRFWRMSAGVPPASPPTMAASAVRWTSLALSSTTPVKIQLSSAMTRPERITNANLSATSLVSPKWTLSIRNTITAMQWSCVAASCGFV
jgi:hypothetical protein